MSPLMQLLKKIKPACDFENSRDFLEDGFFDSLAIMNLLLELEQLCSTDIDIVDIEEEDFVSEDSIVKMVERFGGDITQLV